MTRSDRCPDCGVTLEPVKFGMSDAWKPYVKTSERREGLLGSLGMNEKKEVETTMCPECGRLLFHAKLD
jgi:rRNA maturation protein Nop10